MPAVDVESEPATQDDLRTLRRWVVVAAVWAVAATAVALIALLDDSGRAAERRANETGKRIAAGEQRMEERLARLERRLAAAPTSAQVQQLRSDVTTLERRMEELESDAGDGAGDGGDGSQLPSLRDLFP